MKTLTCILLLTSISCLFMYQTVRATTLAPTPIVGWTTWCTDNGLIPCYDDFCNEDEIKSVVDGMVQNKLFANLTSPRYILLDDCWAAKNRTSDGAIQADSSRFPLGTLKPLADYVHQNGMKLMAYTDAGVYTCRDNRMGSGGHYEQDAKTFAEWELDGVKMDWCDHGHGTEKELYGNFSKALRATGRDMIFYICGWGIQEPGTWAPAIADVWRAGPDHLPLWWTPAGDQDPGVGGGTWNVIQNMAGLSKYAKVGSWATPDFLEPGYFWNGQIEDRTEFSFWCLFSAPLMVATDVRDMSNKEHLYNAEALAINQDPLGQPGDIRVNKTDGSQVWSRALSNGQFAVVLFNSKLFSQEQVNVTFSFDQTHFPGWPSGVNAGQIYCLWMHKVVGTFTNGNVPNFLLKPNDSRFFRITPVNNATALQA